MKRTKIVVGSDGLAIIVHQTNPIESLTTKQLAGLLSGEINDWSQVGGNPGPVNVRARDDLSGAYDTIEHLVLIPYNKSLSNYAQSYESVAALADAVANDRNAIGFVGLPLAQRAKNHCHSRYRRDSADSTDIFYRRYRRLPLNAAPVLLRA